MLFHFNSIQLTTISCLFTSTQFPVISSHLAFRLLLICSRPVESEHRKACPFRIRASPVKSTQLLLAAIRCFSGSVPSPASRFPFPLDYAPIASIHAFPSLQDSSCSVSAPFLRKSIQSLSMSPVSMPFPFM